MNVELAGALTGTFLSDLEKGDIALIKDRLFPEALVMRLAGDDAAIFGRHPENEKAGAFRVSAAEGAWGQNPVAKILNPRIVPDPKSYEIKRHRDFSDSGDVISYRNRAFFFMDNFKKIDAELVNFFGDKMNANQLDGPFVRYKNWSVISGDTTLFVWPPKKTR